MSVDRTPSHETFDIFDLVHTSHCGSRCRTTCLQKKHVHPHVITCLSVCCFLVLSFFFLCLSCLYFLSHFYLFSVLNFNLHVVEYAEHLNPMRTRKMRSIVQWRYTTLSQVVSPTSSTTSSTTSTTQRLVRRSSMNPAT